MSGRLIEGCSYFASYTHLVTEICVVFFAFLIQGVVFLLCLRGGTGIKVGRLSHQAGPIGQAYVPPTACITRCITDRSERKFIKYWKIKLVLVPKFRSVGRFTDFDMVDNI
jgi:hypothetical protein